MVIKHSRSLAFLLLVGLVIFFSSCTKKERTLAGVILGAGLGALIGSVAGNTGGAVAGSLLGGTAGGILGNASGQGHEERNRDHTDPDYWQR